MISVRPPDWDAEAASLWEEGRRAEAVGRAATAAHQAHWQRPELALQCAYYLFILGDHGTALSVLREQLARTPGHVEVLGNTAMLHSRLGQFAPAADLARQVLLRDPDNHNACDTLARSLHELGDDAGASEAGTKSLGIKDRLAPQADPRWRLPEVAPSQWCAGKRNVIAFSLWGAAPRYLRGALRNLLAAPAAYPGWTVQLHIDSTVPTRFTELAKALGAQLCLHQQAPTRERLTWRFLVANDPAVGRFLVRDADSVVSEREAIAVNEWIASDRWFHAMRDWWTHTDLLLAGLWGGVAGVLPDLRALLADYRPAALETPNIDQWFLRDRVWPFVRQSCLVHDRCFDAPGAQRWPGPPPVEGWHVGQDEHAAHPDEQARLLGPWLARLEG